MTAHESACIWITSPFYKIKKRYANCWIQSVCLVINAIQELMKMMGMRSWLYWASWFVKYLMFMLTAVITMTILFHAPISTNGAVIVKTSPIITFVFLLLYTLTIIAFCFILTTLINKGKGI